MDKLQALIDVVIASNPLQRPFLESSLSELKTSEKDELESYLSYCTKQGLGLDFLADCYNTIVKDTLREQVYFLRNKRYRCSSYAEVAGSVYLNDNYMKRYMYGLAMTTTLWPNHREIHRFFSEVLPKETSGNYLEIGPGHGVYFMNAMRSCQYGNYQAVDISPTSIALTRSILESGEFGDFRNFDLVCDNFLNATFSGKKFDAIVMGEVLEHVENPAAFMNKIRELSNPGTFIFVTTAINAPAIDHIYLFESPEAVHDLVQQAGFRVVSEKISPYPSLDLTKTMELGLPVNIALQLSLVTP